MNIENDIRVLVVDNKSILNRKKCIKNATIDSMYVSAVTNTTIATDCKISRLYIVEIEKDKNYGNREWVESLFCRCEIDELIIDNTLHKCLENIFLCCSIKNVKLNITSLLNTDIIKNMFYSCTITKFDIDISRIKGIKFGNKYNIANNSVIYNLNINGNLDSTKLHRILVFEYVKIYSISGNISCVTLKESIASINNCNLDTVMLALKLYYGCLDRLYDVNESRAFINSEFIIKIAKEVNIANIYIEMCKNNIRYNILRLASIVKSDTFDNKMIEVKMKLLRVKDNRYFKVIDDNEYIAQMDKFKLYDEI